VAAAGVAQKSGLVLVGTGAVVAYIGMVAVLPGARDTTQLRLEPRAGAWWTGREEIPAREGCGGVGSGREVHYTK
jgi:hypothetical protein